MAANYVLIERIELRQSAASISFLNIPQSGYTDLKIVASARSNRADTDDLILVKPNNSSSNLTYRAFTANGASTSSGTLNRIYVDANTFTGNTFSNTEIYFPNFTSSSYKSFSADSVTENNGTTSYMGLVAGLWSDTTAISSLVLAPVYGTAFTQYSTFALYGIAATGTTPPTAKAYGGDTVITDGTYWYHAFLTTGAFVPQTSLTCDVLTIAGGGGAGKGGGGAGGYIYSSNQTLAPNSYTATVGAGGAAGTYDTANGVNGNISNLTGGLLSLTQASGGGGGGATNGGNGSSGASGGGAAYRYPSGGGTGGAASPSGQGNAGGNALSSSPGYGSGGGGGAGAAGGAGSAGGGGAGGVGISTYSSWGSVTATGQNVSGTYYYCGGGGGGADSGAGAGGYGGGGTGVAISNPNAGLVNTGGGAGGNNNGTAAAGGSGIVIIRYLVA